MTARHALAAAVTLAILAACSVPGSRVPDVQIDSVDKLVHVAMFFAFGLLWRRASASPVRVAVGGVAFALFIEVWQHVLPIGRSGDPYDAAADVVGLALALGLSSRRWRSNSASGPVSR